MVASKMTLYYNDSDFLRKAKITAALKNKSLSQLVRDLLADSIAEQSSKGINELQPDVHNPPSVFDERVTQKNKFLRMKQVEIEEYEKSLKKHVDLFRKRKEDFGLIW